MGQQQLLLIILGVIIVGIAIAVGLSLFAANSVQANRDAIINDISNLGANAYQYRIRPASMAGGGGSYLGYLIPFKMSSNDNAVYSISAAGGATGISFRGSSSSSGTASTVVGDVDVNGRITFAAAGFTGDFKQE